MMLDRTPENARPIHLRLNGGEVGIVVSCNVSGLEAFNLGGDGLLDALNPRGESR
jgi:hypothetical protein